MNPFLIIQEAWDLRVVSYFVTECMCVLLVCIPVELFSF